MRHASSRDFVGSTGVVGEAAAISTSRPVGSPMNATSVPSATRKIG